VKKIATEKFYTDKEKLRANAKNASGLKAGMYWSAQGMGLAGLLDPLAIQCIALPVLNSDLTGRPFFSRGRITPRCCAAYAKIGAGP